MTFGHAYLSYSKIYMQLLFILFVTYIIITTDYFKHSSLSFHKFILNDEWVKRCEEKLRVVQINETGITTN